MVDRACEVALRESFAEVGDTLVIIAGMPFGIAGTTNMLRIAQVASPDETAGDNGTG
jgi:pyruvate kinase